jgi:Protein of unknown function (DUF3159)
MPDGGPATADDAQDASDTEGAEAEQEPQYTTVEELVRHQLSTALGGVRGIVEGAVPTLGFTISWISTHELKLSLAISVGLAVVLLVVRIVQRSTIQFVFNSLFAIGIAAIFALRSGRAEDAFLPGLIYNSVYAVGLSFSALVRWPVVGFMIGAVMGDPTAWRQDRQLLSLCTKLTWILAAPCFIRVLVQYPLWASHHAGWLGIAKLAMGWPLQVATFAAMVWLLNRDSTPVEIPARRLPSAARSDR